MLRKLWLFGQVRGLCFRSRSGYCEKGRWRNRAWIYPSIDLSSMETKRVWRLRSTPQAAGGSSGSFSFVMAIGIGRSQSGNWWEPAKHGIERRRGFATARRSHGLGFRTHLTHGNSVSRVFRRLALLLLSSRSLRYALSSSLASRQNPSRYAPFPFMRVGSS